MRFQIDFDYDINVDITSRTNIYEAPNFESFLRIASHKPDRQNISFLDFFIHHCSELLSASLMNGCIQIASLPTLQMMLHQTKWESTSLQTTIYK